MEYLEKRNEITSFCLGGKDLKKWMHQNGASVSDIQEGCLLDNYLIDCKNGIAAVFENYLNANLSNYIVCYARTNKTRKDGTSPYLDVVHEFYSRFEGEETEEENAKSW